MEESTPLDWESDQATTGSGTAGGSADLGTASPYLDLTNNGDDTTYGSSTSGFVNNTLYPDALFNQERFNNNNAPANMQWNFPVELGYYTVNLLFAERFSGNQNVGDRVFDIELEGTKVAENFDQVAQYGYNTAGVAVFTNVLVTDGVLDIDFIKKIENPNIKAIEIILSRKVANDYPTITETGNLYGYTGQTISRQIEATDGDNATQILTYNAQNLPEGLMMAPATGLITGTIAPTAVANSPYEVIVTVTDNGEATLSAESSFTWEVTESDANQGSIMSTVNLQGRTDHSGTYTIKAYEINDLTTPAYEFSSNGNPTGILNELPVNQDTYKIGINYPGYLQRVIEVTITGLEQAIDFGELTAGDVNGDNFIDGADLSILNILFFKSSTNPEYDEISDINQDGIIDGADLSIINFNFFISGDSF